MALQDLNKSIPRNELEQLDNVVSKQPQFEYKTEFQSHEPEVRPLAFMFFHILKFCIHKFGLMVVDVGNLVCILHSVRFLIMFLCYSLII